LRVAVLSHPLASERLLPHPLRLSDTHAERVMNTALLSAARIDRRLKRWVVDEFFDLGNMDIDLVVLVPLKMPTRGKSISVSCWWAQRRRSSSMPNLNATAIRSNSTTTATRTSS